MSISISCDDDALVPRDVTMTLTCDGDHGFLPQTTGQWTGRWYPDLHIRAVGEGWLFRDGGIHLGPCCSGKKTKGIVS